MTSRDVMSALRNIYGDREPCNGWDMDLGKWLFIAQPIFKAHDEPFNFVDAILVYDSRYVKEFVLQAMKDCRGIVADFPTAYFKLQEKHTSQLLPIDLSVFSGESYYNVHERCQMELDYFIDEKLKKTTERYKTELRNKFMLHWLRQKYECSDEVFEIMLSQAKEDLHSHYSNLEYEVDVDTDYYGFDERFESLYSFYLKVRNL